jgi:hypothetical protein
MKEMNLEFTAVLQISEDEIQIVHGDAVLATDSIKLASEALRQKMQMDFPQTKGIILYCHTKKNPTK